MEARLICLALISAAACSLGASHRTQNFVSTAPTQQLAVEIGEAAEKYRRDLAIEWQRQPRCPRFLARPQSTQPMGIGRRYGRRTPWYRRVIVTRGPRPVV